MGDTRSSQPARLRVVRLFSVLISVRLATVLLLVFFGVTVLGAVIPQGGPPEQYTEKYGRFLGGVVRLVGLDHTFHAWWFSVVLALVFFQILLCTVGRFSAAWVQLVRPADFRPEGSLHRAKVSATPDEVVCRARAMGYREVGVQSDGVVLARGRLQPLGFILLHVSLLVLVLGLWWNAAEGFTEVLPVPVGERVLESHSNRLVEVTELRPGFQKVGGEEGGYGGMQSGAGYELASMEADIVVYDGGRIVRRGSVHLGDSMSFDRGQIVLVPSLARHQVLLEVSSGLGKPILDRLSADNDSVSLPGRDDLLLTVVDFAPDAVIEGSGLRRLSPELRAPVARLQVTQAGSVGSAPVAEGILRPGELLTAEGFTVTFADAVYMPTVVVSSRTADPLVIGGIVAQLIGLVLALGFSFKQLLLTPVGDGVEVRAFARRRNQPLGKELATLARTREVVGEETESAP